MWEKAQRDNAAAAAKMQADAQFESLQRQINETRRAVQLANEKQERAARIAADRQRRASTAVQLEIKPVPAPTVNSAAPAPGAGLPTQATVVKSYPRPAGVPYTVKRDGTVIAYRGAQVLKFPNLAAAQAAGVIQPVNLPNSAKPETK